ncbi:GSCFA domain-containing protein [Methylocystis heyeri]|uniref:GSCFA domain-containing protein n=1 Tax=Methylocystis heyeri TaxID=391905 RepID=A0A6B8KEC2_9HYPH|nr:GSCFA domain-containing protein [Methylocystis heyeri]QGM45355.1 GSCFA domain-containing protein [Methylocystis heyeri]
MASHPYSRLPDYANWRRAVSRVAPGELDPMVEAPFRFDAGARVVTAGSCFAQHIGRFLKAKGCCYLVTEPAHAIVGPKARDVLNYGLYSARYGNIYTSRQLLQLFERAYGRFVPGEDVWREDQTVFLDPFRPNIQPLGFNSLREYEIDRARHFQAVRDAFENLDVFVFTLGLTECWRSRADGAVFPVCPGVVGGTFSPERHEFVNLTVEDVVSDMSAFIGGLRGVNPGARIILTVSPVPLVATAEPRHVLVSTVYSKSVLRVACERLVQSFEGVAYFPSYEIIAGGFASKNYFAEDKRSVTQEGVDHVMAVFERHFIEDSPEQAAMRLALQLLNAQTDSSPLQNVSKAMKLMCDEEALDFDSSKDDVRRKND